MWYKTTCLCENSAPLGRGNTPPSRKTPPDVVYDHMSMRKFCGERFLALDHGGDLKTRQRQPLLQIYYVLPISDFVGENHLLESGTRGCPCHNIKKFTNE